MVPSAHGILLVKSCWWAHLLSSVISQSGPSPLVCQYRSLFTSGLSLLLGLLTICPGITASSHLFSMASVLFTMHTCVVLRIRRDEKAALFHSRTISIFSIETGHEGYPMYHSQFSFVFYGLSCVYNAFICHFKNLKRQEGCGSPFSHNLNNYD
jgi:hypothetical protein